MVLLFIFQDWHSMWLIHENFVLKLECLFIGRWGANLCWCPNVFHSWTGIRSGWCHFLIVVQKKPSSLLYSFYWGDIKLSYIPSPTLSNVNHSSFFFKSHFKPANLLNWSEYPLMYAYELFPNYILSRLNLNFLTPLLCWQICVMLCADHGPCVSGAHNTIVTARAGKDLVSSLVSGRLHFQTLSLSDMGEVCQ